MYDSIIEKLNSQIDNKKTVHAYLFEINNYDEDYKVVLNFVKMLLSNMNYNDVVNSNTHYFKQIDNEEYVDLYVVEPESNGIKKNQMINLMEEFNNKSLLDNKKIYIIKECEKFNSHSANTILKFLEEPNDDIIGILLTNNRYKVIDTIISRCQVITFIDDTKFDVDDDYIDLIDFILNIKKNITSYDDIYKKYFSDKLVSKNSLLYLEEVFINTINNNIKLIILNDYDDKIISNLIIVIEEEVSKLKFNVNLNLWFDDFIVSVMEVLE